LSDYRAQKRGGRGKSATAMKDEDFVDTLFVASMHDTVLFFTSVGKVYWKRVYELPVASRGSRGRPIVNLLPLEENERVNAVLTVREYSEDRFVFFATSKGVVKKTALSDFSRPRANGIIAIDLRVDDFLIDVMLTDGDSDVMLLSSGGRAMRFNESKVRTMGRTAAGVRGIKMPEEDTVIGLIVVAADESSDSIEILTATQNGYGKRTKVGDYPTRVGQDDQIMLITDAGTLVRTNVAEVSSLGRNTQGVRLIRLSEGEKLVEITAIDESDAQAGEDADVEDAEVSAVSDAADDSTDAGTPDASSKDDSDNTEADESDDSDEPGDAT